MIGRLDQMSRVWVAQQLVIILAVYSKFLDYQYGTLSCRNILIIFSVDEEDLSCKVLDLGGEAEVE